MLPHYSTPQHLQLWKLAGPLILSNLSIPLLGLVDTAVVGHLDHSYYLGAVALGALIFSFLFWGFGFLRMSTTGLIAQSLGSEDYQELRTTLMRATLLAMIFALLIISLQLPLSQFAFFLLEGSSEVEQYAQQYVSIRIWSAPATLLNYVLIGWLLGMHNARGPLWILLASNLSNILLDLWFVLGLGMTVDGVALATVIAEYIGCGVGLMLVYRELKQYPACWCLNSLSNWQKLKSLIILNSNIMIRTLSLLFALAFFTAQGAKMGDLVLAANAILMNFQTLTAYALDGFAHAAEAMVGRAIGKKNSEQFFSAIYTAGFWSIALALIFSGIYLITGEALIALLSDIEELRNVASEYLIWAILMPLVAVWSYLLDGIFIGATRSVEMRNTMLLSLLIFLCCWWLLQPLHNHGLWLALTLFMAARGITMGWSLQAMIKAGKLL